MDGTNTQAVGFRLSPQQERLLQGGGQPPVNQCAVVLNGPLDPARLRDALEQAAERHEILRTSFVQPPGMLTPQQAIGEDPAQAVSLEQAPEAARLIEDPDALAALMSEQAQRESGIESNPPLRAVLAGAEEQRPVLLLTASAACADATSLLALVGELCEAYEGAAGGEEPVQYADYAEWRYEQITGEEPPEQEGLAFWREDAQARPAAPRILFALPADGPGQEGRQVAGQPVVRGECAAVALDLTGVALQELQEAAVETGTSAPVLLEAAWHALLARLSGASELLVAGWCDGRAQPDLAGAVGSYEQPAPVHSRFQPATTFAETADQVRRSRAAAVRHQDYAGAAELAALAEQAAAGWMFHNAPALPAPATALLALRTQPAGTRLTLALRSSGGALAGELLYDPSAVPEQDARELAERFPLLLRSALADTSQQVAQLQIAGEAERGRLLSGAAANAAVKNTITVHELLERQAQMTPERAAVSAPSRSLTYAELDAAANRLAHHLAALGVQRGHTVAVCMERSPSLIVALMAILKAGGAYLPLNYEHPQARVAHQCSDAGATVVVSEEHLLSSLPAGLTAVCVDRDAEAIAACPSESPGVQVSGEDRVYVMYTSGSTGLPKGVAVTHGNLANYAAAIAQRLQAAEGWTFGVVSAIATDLGNTSVFAPLACGGCIRLIGAQAAMDGELLAQELAGARVDVLKIAPSHLRALLGAGRAEVLPSRWLIVGGEALSWELVQQVRELSGACRILNHYGPTETTVGATAYTVDEQRRPETQTVPIGFPLPGVRAYVLDRLLQPVPVGVPGELCIAGAGVAAGYLNAGEDAAGFTEDPFEGGRMYRTGDRVRLLRDGAIEFLGRLDDQVKIRGFRVQPGEVEAALAEHPAVRQVAVCAEDDQRGGARLAAYLVSPQPPAVEELRAFLAERLPEHMIPSSFRTAESLPLNASGKVDRSALAGLAELQARREAEYVAPRDEVEQQIAGIWGELLEVERVGAFDDFFALGGHSLLATQATMRIRRLYGEIPLRALLAAPTVAALADVVRATAAGAAAL